MPAFIVVSGLPGSVKSTLSGRLAHDLGLPWLNKDTILEALFDSLGVGDAAWRERLSRAADDILYAVATESSGAVLDNWWHHDTSPSRLEALPGRLIEVFCDCPPEIAIRRAQARERHPGHLDASMSDADMANWCARIAATYPGPLGVGERTLRVRTDETVDLPDLLSALTAVL